MFFLRFCYHFLSLKIIDIIFFSESMNCGLESIIQVRFTAQIYERDVQMRPYNIIITTPYQLIRATQKTPPGGLRCRLPKSLFLFYSSVYTIIILIVYHFLFYFKLQIKLTYFSLWLLLGPPLTNSQKVYTWSQFTGLTRRTKTHLQLFFKIIFECQMLTLSFILNSE